MVDLEIVDKVNGLVKRAFGSNYDGRFKERILTFNSDYPFCISNQNELGVITKNTPSGGKGYLVGEFKNQDGSYLVIQGTLFRSNERKAMIFAKLYKKEFGREVRLERVPLRWW